MTKLNTLRSAATAAIAVAALSLPSMAQARHNDCKAQENEARIAGAVIGAVLGGVLGSEVSGNGARTEGSAIGAVLGGLAGAGIGDESVDCDKIRRTTYQNGNYTRTTYGNGSYSGQTYGSNTPAVYRRPVSRRRTVTTRRGYGQPNYGHGQPVYRPDPIRRDNRWLSQSDRRRLAQTQTSLDDVRFRLRDLRQEEKRLERRIRRNDGRWAYQRQSEVRVEIERLRKKKRRLQRRKQRILNS